MTSCQPGILAEVPPLARYLTFVIQELEQVAARTRVLPELVDGEHTITGIGLSLAMALNRKVPGLQNFPCCAGAGIDIPASPAALWFWLKGTDRGELLHRSRLIERRLAPVFSLTASIDAFKYQTGFDLTGYEDGTENPQGAAAAKAAIIGGSGAGLDGSSYVAVQSWRHDLDRFERLPEQEQDHTIGRRKHGNVEIADAPPAAHVKRTAQESFQPPAFILRRSMPWASGQSAGLMFVAFGKSFTAFESLLQRMTGATDGITDALFTFTRPVTGNYYWCPPLLNGRLDLSMVGI